MLTLGSGARVYLALSPVDMRPSRPAGRARSADRIIRLLTDDGFDGLTALVQHVLQRDPFGGQLFLFRSRRGDRLKAVWWDGTGLCLFAKRLERGSFVWPAVKEGALVLTGAGGRATAVGPVRARSCRRQRRSGRSMAGWRRRR